MRVLQLISSSGFFGAEKVMLRLVQGSNEAEAGSAAAGLIVNLHRPDPGIVEQFRREGLDPVTFPTKGTFDWAAIRRLRAYLRTAKVDVVHSHGYKSDTYALLAAARLPVWRVATCHNWIEDRPRLKAYAALDRRCLRHFHRVVAVSREVGERLRASGIRPDRLEIIGNGIDGGDFSRGEARTRLREELGIPASATVIGTVGRLSREKGQEVLIRAFQALGVGSGESALLIVGDGPDRGRLEELAGASPVRFTGYREDVGALLSAMDIFALPSLTEGLPLALLEAMAARLPVVASRVGEVPAVLEEGVSGWSLTPGDAAALAAALRRLVDDPGLRFSAGEAARRTVEGRYSGRAMVEAYATLYRGLARDRQRRGGPGRNWSRALL